MPRKQMSEARTQNEALDALDAIRLAIQGAANEATALAVTNEILRNAAPTGDPTSTRSVRVFLDAVTALNGKYEVVDP